MTQEQRINLPVWLYWEGDRLDWIKACQRTVFVHAANVHLITPKDFDELRDCDRDIDLSNLCTPHRADFIRAFLLCKYGGVWIDSDCLVMHSLSPLVNLLIEYDFIGYKERQGYVSNNFMGAKANSKVASTYYQRLCKILRSGQPIEWLTLGSHALTESIKDAGVPWLELNVELIQPICWSHPESFFAVRDDREHEMTLNRDSYCYMLSANMVRGFFKKNSFPNLLGENTFFSFLLKKSLEQNYASDFINIEYRENTDDDIWILPEVVKADMYKIKEVIAKNAPAFPGYVIDCGAHIGAFSVMCTLYLKNIEVIAFEPNPDSFIYLSKNADKFGDIQAFNKAVDIKDGTLNLYKPDKIEWSGRWGTIPNSNEYITVESINLISFIRNLDKQIFILKLDLEGYEELIINNSNKEDLAGIMTIIVETHSSNFNHDRLKEFGFQLLFQPNISSDRQFVYTRC